MHVNKRICLPALALSIAASMMIMRAAMAGKAESGMPRDYQQISEMWATGRSPWVVWDRAKA